MASGGRAIFGAVGRLGRGAETLADAATAGAASNGRLAHVLAALDEAAITERALERYVAQRGRVAQEVIEADPFAVAVMELARDASPWSGTSTELLERITPEAPKSRWTGPRAGRQ